MPSRPRHRLEIPDYIVVVVSDLDRSLHFYTEVLGLRLGHRAGAYAQLDTGATRIALFERGAMESVLERELLPPNPAALASTLGFKVDDVDASVAAFVGQGAEAAVPPTTRPWGQRTAYLRDPDGHLIELAAPLAESP